MVFLKLRRQCGFSHEVRWGTQGASRAAPGKSPSSSPGNQGGPGVPAHWGLSKACLACAHTDRQVACHSVNNSKGKRSSIPPYKTRPDSPVPTLQGPCDQSQKWTPDGKKGSPFCCSRAHSILRVPGAPSPVSGALGPSAQALCWKRSFLLL